MEPPDGSRREDRAALALGAALALWTLGVLLAWDAPFTDLPQHAFTLEVLRHPEVYGERYLTRLSALDTNTPWFLLDRLLAPWLGSETSLALAYAIAIAATPFATAAWARRLGRDGALALLLSWWTAWNGMIYWGFFHYGMATGLGVLVLAWDRDLQRGGRGRLRVAAAWVLLYSLHVQAWVWTCAIAAFQRLAWRREEGLGTWAHLAGWLPSAALAGAWLVDNLVVEDDIPLGSLSSGLGIRYKPFLRTAWNLVPNLAASLAWTPFDEVVCIALLALGALGFGATRRRGDPRDAVVPLVIGLASVAAYFLVPREMKGQYHISNRLLVVLPVAAAVLASPRLPPLRRRAALLGAGVVAVASQAANHETVRRWAEESAPAFALMERIPPGERVMFWPGSRESGVALGAPYTHIMSWYAARTHGETHFSFAEFRPNPVVYRDHPGYPRSLPGEEFRPWCTAFRGGAIGFDHVVARGDGPALHCAATRRYASSLREVTRVGEWILYQVTGPLPALDAPDCWCDPL